MKVEIIIENEFTFETEVIDAVNIPNAQILTFHLNKEYKIRITTFRGVMTFSGLNAWHDISEFYRGWVELV